MTNSHVVLGSQEIQVTLQDGRTSREQVRGIDMKTDIAVIHVNYEDLPVPEMAKRVEVKIGQTAVAMGTPFGLVGGPTVTVGIVGALNRSIQKQVSPRASPHSEWCGCGGRHACAFLHRIGCDSREGSLTSR